MSVPYQIASGHRPAWQSGPHRIQKDSQIGVRLVGGRRVLLCHTRDRVGRGGGCGRRWKQLTEEYLVVGAQVRPSDALVPALVCAPVHVIERERRRAQQGKGGM